jgi:hypothetical protein
MLLTRLSIAAAITILVYDRIHFYGSMVFLGNKYRAGCDTL